MLCFEAFPTQGRGAHGVHLRLAADASLKQLNEYSLEVKKPSEKRRERRATREKEGRPSLSTASYRPQDSRHNALQSLPSALSSASTEQAAFLSQRMSLVPWTLYSTSPFKFLKPQ